MHPVQNLEFIARQFFFIKKWRGATAVGHGKINDTYRISFELEQGPCDFILQRLNHAVFKNPEAVMENMASVGHYLSENGYPLGILTPLPTLLGDNLARDAQHNYWRVLPYFENTFTPDDASNPAWAQEAAAAYSTFLNYLREFPVEGLHDTIPGFHDSMQRWEKFELAKENVGLERHKKANSAIKILDKCLDAIFKPIDQLKKSGALPLRVTHNDTKSGNILLDATTHKAVAVIDWDTIMPGTILSDFGDMMRTFAPDKTEEETDPLGLRLDAIEALTRGFLSETASWMAPAEKDNLLLGAKWIIAEQALRFLTDYLEGDVYYPTRYADHNLKRTENQLALLAAIEQREAEIQGLIDRALAAKP